MTDTSNTVKIIKKVISLTITSYNFQCAVDVTWRHRSRNHRTRRGHFPIGGQWWPCTYLARIRRYGASKILGSRVWSFGVTWRHQSRDH